ncbi:MAG TPA: PAS domain-containing protein, partial [Chroococcales cyanobacterium]
MQADGRSREQLLARIDELERQLAQANVEKANLEILVETVTEHATCLENEVHQNNQEMLSYIQQVEKLTTAAVAVETNTFEPESLDGVTARSDELGGLARVFAQMVKTLKTREQELAAASDRLEAILNAVPGAISWLDANGVYMGLNRHLAEHWQLSQDAFIGKEVGFLKGSDGFAEFIRQFLGSPQDSASEIVKVEGRDAVYYYLIAARKYQQGAATVSVGIDVTERKKTEEALRRSEQWFRTLISNIPGAIYRCQCEADWTMEFISDAIAQISGYAASEFIQNQSRTFTSIIHPNDRESIETLIHQAVAARHPYNLAYRIL